MRVWNKVRAVLKDDQRPFQPFRSRTHRLHQVGRRLDQAPVNRLPASAEALEPRIERVAKSGSVLHND